MNSLSASELKTRTISKAYQFAYMSRTTWIALVIFVRTLAAWLIESPIVLARRLTPARTVVGLVIAALVVIPSTAYFVEKNHHEETRRAYHALNVSTAGEMAFLRASLREFMDERDRLAGHLLDSGAAVYSGKKVRVKVIATGYTSSVFETDSTPFVTAANTATREGILAMSRDLLREYTPGAPFSFGDHVRVSGLGDFLVEDVMNARWSNRIDVWFGSQFDAYRFGCQEVYVTGTIEDGPFDETDVLTKNTGDRQVASGM